MRNGPDVSHVAALIGEPARANMLTALMDGRALTATELAAEAGVTAPTASAHLARLEAGGLLRPRRQGRHKFFALAGPEVGRALEALMGLAAASGRERTRTGPKEPALREARVCYDHLAGDRGVRMFDALLATGRIARADGGLALTEAGRAFADEFGLAIAAPGRAALCRECLDWSARRSHLAGRVGRALLARIEDLGWARREPGSRIVRFTAAGARAFDARFPPVDASPLAEKLNMCSVHAKAGGNRRCSTPA